MGCREAVLDEEPDKRLRPPMAVIIFLSRSKKAYCAVTPTKEGRCNAESITVAYTYIRTVTASSEKDRVSGDEKLQRYRC